MRTGVTTLKGQSTMIEMRTMRENQPITTKEITHITIMVVVAAVAAVAALQDKITISLSSHVSLLQIQNLKILAYTRCSFV